jgi:hypothetical protein
LLGSIAKSCRVTDADGGKIACSVKKVGDSMYAFFEDKLHARPAVYQLVY